MTEDAKFAQYDSETTRFTVRCKALHPDLPDEPEVEYVIVADRAGAAALNQLFDSLSTSRCRYPVTTGLEIRDDALAMLLDHGLPPRELHEALAELETERLNRERPGKFLPPLLLALYTHLVRLAGTPADRCIKALESGAPWGIAGPIVLVGRLPHSFEHYLTINQDTLVVGRDPVWPEGEPVVRLSTLDPELLVQVAHLLDVSFGERPRGEDWGEDLEEWADTARLRAGVPRWGDTMAEDEVEMVAGSDDVVSRPV